MAQFGIGTLDNSWTDNYLCTKWFEESFILKATAWNKSEKLVLVVWDDHKSHETLGLLELAIADNIMLFCLPRHTTHKIQPLNIGVFGPFTREWLDRCNHWVSEYDMEMHRGYLSKNTWKLARKPSLRAQ